MSFFLSYPTSARSKSHSGLVKPALTVIAMALALGHVVMPAVAANAATASADYGSLSADAHVPGAQSLAAPSAIVSAPLEQAEYAAESGEQLAAAAAIAAEEAIALLGGHVVWPYDHAVPSNGGFGPRSAPCSGCSTFHDGMDFGGGNGTPIQSIADGVVITANNDGGGYGSYVEIQHTIDGRTITSLYAHMQYGSLGLSVGQSVTAGQFVGLTGTTGQSTGPHLHLELYYEDGVRIDPEAWLSANVR